MQEPFHPPFPTSSLRKPRVPTATKPRLHIVGAGWAGLSAAVHASLAGWQVELYEAAHQAGGRARAAQHQGQTYDNGQHLLIGAYRDTLELLSTIGVKLDAVLDRSPLHLCDARGQGLRLGDKASVAGLLRAIVHNTRWRALDRLSLLGLLASIGVWRGVHLTWRRVTGQCWDVSVAALCALASRQVQRDLIEPLCLAALNAPPLEASAVVFVRVLVDAFANAPASCDFLLPRVNLSALLATPATQWLKDQGASLHWGSRIQSLGELPRSAGEPVILATSAWQAAHLTQDAHPEWSDCAKNLQHYPIATVYVSAQTAPNRGPIHDPVVMLESSPTAPAQFAIQTHFKSKFASGMHAHEGDTPFGTAKENMAQATSSPVWAFVVSDSRGQEREALIEGVLAQAAHDLGLKTPRLEACFIEKRATFAPLVDQKRPPMEVAKDLWACGDYIRGPYPSTLEGAVRSGKAVIDALMP